MNNTLTAILLAALLATGCAASPAREPHDPWEGFNRKVYAFNDTFDRAILRPVSEVYDEALPRPVNDAVTNFFGNLGDVVVFTNDLLQLKFLQAGSDLARIGFNTTAGVFGLFDVASALDFPKHDEDFGQTLGYWGVPTGPYLVVPFFGPRDLRDGFGLAVDWSEDPLRKAPREETYWAGVSLRAVDTRADLLRVSRVVEEAALDPYVFMREGYLQRRTNQVYDGNPPQQEEFDPFDLEESDQNSTPGGGSSATPPAAP